MRTPVACTCSPGAGDRDCKWFELCLERWRAEQRDLPAMCPGQSGGFALTLNELPYCWRITVPAVYNDSGIMQRGSTSCDQFVAEGHEGAGLCSEHLEEMKTWT
jgi:hypothetical protein